MMNSLVFSETSLLLCDALGHLFVFGKAACNRSKDGFKTCVYIISLLLTSPTTEVHRGKPSLPLKLTLAHTYMSFDGQTERFMEASETRNRYIWTY